VKAYWGVAVQTLAFLTSALDGGERSASLPGHFTPKEKAFGTPLYRRLGGPKSRSGRGVE
jgi:hypothetical protein